MGKEKYLQIFKYLKEFSSLRDTVVRDIDAKETQYPEKIWLNDIPDDVSFENIIRPNFNDDNSYWLKAKKPQEPEEPKFAKLSDTLKKWIDHSTLLDKNKLPQLQKPLEVNGESPSIEERSKIEKELQQYIDTRWRDDRIEYKKKKENYDKEKKLNDVYKQLYRIHNKIKQSEEEYELVIGVGLLNFKENEEKSKIFRHILTQRVDIDFELHGSNSQIIIAPNLEFSPQMEKDLTLELSEHFYSQSIQDAESKVENDIKEERIETVFSDSIEDTLKIFAERFSSEGRYNHIFEKPNSTQTKPIITFSPALLLRKRNTWSLTALYGKILENIEDSDAALNITMLDELLDDSSKRSDDSFNSPPSDSFSSNDPEPIFFPKEYNDEQIEIVKKTMKSNKVLVQGPPGTGKSHTIANLICHLLANGKKILITAYSKRALEVLKDKLPPEFQKLVVSLFSGDSSSIKDLQSSVNAINDELTRADITQYQSQIDALEKEWDKKRRAISETLNERIDVKKQTTQKYAINLNYAGTLTEIAETLKEDAALYEWYRDDFSDSNDIDDLLSKLKEFIALDEKYQQMDTDEFDLEIPNRNRLLTHDQLQEYAKITDLAKSHFPKDEPMEVHCTDFEKLLQSLQELKTLYEKSDKLQIDFAETIIESSLKDGSQEWEKRLEQAEPLLHRLEEHDLREFARDTEVSYPKGKSLKQLKTDAQILLSYLKEGNSLGGLSFQMKKIILPKEIKERLYFKDEVYVNGSPCDTIKEYETVLKDISFQQDFNELSEIWSITDADTTRKSISNKFSFFKQIQEEIPRLLELVKKANALKSEIESTSSLQIKLFDKENLNNSILKTENGRIKDLITRSLAYLKQEKIHPIKEKIIDIYNKKDYRDYIELLHEIDGLHDSKDSFLQYRELHAALHAKVPYTITSVEDNSFPVQKVQDLKPAIYFRQAQHQLDKLMKDNQENDLRQRWDVLKREEGNLIADLASKKAWYQVIQDLQGNRSLQSHLNAWVLAIKKIGKTGKGKRAMRARKDAQQEMKYCKDSIPCWIMPLYKVAETIQPQQGMYDYVIIDEASQIGPEGIFLCYISKNIIIIGDDKQTSPEFVGVNEDGITSLIQRHLSGIPFSGYYAGNSFFDFAKILCDKTVLREHFRCMPEIIEFSNRYFYEPEGIGLYPLKQYSEVRLEPLKTKFCSDGYTEGEGAKIINRPEAQYIVEEIEKIVNDKRYAQKTIGVITLQGSQQANLIEKHLLSRIDEKEFRERKIVCGNSSSFQGDERDIIFLSLVTAPNHKRAVLSNPEAERRFNVAVSRAKEQVWLFHSVRLDGLSNKDDLRYKLLNHFENYKPDHKVLQVPIKKQGDTPPEPFDSWFEVEVHNDIIRKQLGVIPQYRVGRYRIDLVVLLPDGSKIAVECDGDKWHGPEQYENDVMRQRNLERCGWQFFRVRGSEYYTDKEKALEPLWNRTQNGYPVSNDQAEDNITEVISSITNITAEVLTSEEPMEQSNSNFKTDTNLRNITGSLNEEAQNPPTDKIIRYFNLFNSGVYVLTHKEELKEADFVIPLQDIHRKGFLLQCYHAGHINKVPISVLLSKKIGKEYSNGLNSEDELASIHTIDSEKIIGICFNENGNKKFKAHLSESISIHQQLHSKGNKVIYNDFHGVEYIILPLEIHDDIKRLIAKSFTSNGKNIDNEYYASEWELLSSTGIKL